MYLLAVGDCGKNKLIVAIYLLILNSHSRVCWDPSLFSFSSPVISQ